MRDQILSETKAAMKSGDKVRVTTLRMISAAIKQRDIDARVDNKGTATGITAVDDAEVLQVLQKMVKQRRDSIAAFTDAGRTELAEKEAAEIEVIEAFLPKQLSEAETEAAADAVIAELGASGMPDMGRVMGALKEKYGGQMDFGKASGIVKKRLAS
ncbi:MAG: GatB/YqeY domain-containing protein [Pseudomonadota bacterium]